MYSEDIQPQTAAAAAAPRRQRTGVWTMARRKPLGAISAVILCGLIATAALAPVIAPYDPYRFNLNERGLPIRLHAPDARFLFGTDTHGRDVLSRIIYGTRVSLVVGFLSVAIGTLGGTVIGLLSGYWEGMVDHGLQRCVDTLMAFPGVVLALAVLSVFGQSLANVILVIGLVIAPGASRVVRGSVLSVKQNAYIDAARAAGASSWRLMVWHILPNVLAPILIIASVWLGNAIVIEAALSFLGFGTPPPTPTWGGMLSGEGRRSLETAPYLALFPGLAISIVVLAFNMFGDAVRDLLDPRLRTR
ncbi:MAG: ABC transporter permease [Candidatus Tectomicrobia bacterium]|uniref:ABC transporter permease n=1 Tax=Tectimicrobiota bacterium TaxID=2528274 RepID=A0A937VZH7_UNCTE|nr:ABC transporter permease [Candidatus Tectomicrobia bacterium]